MWCVFVFFFIPVAVFFSVVVVVLVDGAGAAAAWAINPAGTARSETSERARASDLFIENLLAPLEKFVRCEAERTQPAVNAA